MARRGLLNFPVVGVGRSGIGRDKLIERAKASVTEYGGLHPEGFARLAEQMRYKVWSHPFLLSGSGSLRLSLSLGLAVYDGHPDYQQLLRRAEQALVRAAAEGGNRVVIAG